MRQWNKIVCPTDFSSGSLAALRVADELAGTFSSELILVHACPALHKQSVPLRPSAVSTNAGAPLNEEAFQEALQAELEKVARENLSAPEQARKLVVEAEPFEGILDVARQEDAGLIVIATHGRTGARRFLLGSVAERVVRLSHCPVLTVRTAEPEQEGSR